MVFVVTIHSQRFKLHDETQVHQVRSDIEAAVRQGGAFVEIPERDRVAEVLVTPSSPVRIDEVQSIAAGALEPSDYPSELDFLDYGTL